MKVVKALRQMHGRAFGLGPGNEPIFNGQNIGLPDHAQAVLEGIVQIDTDTSDWENMHQTNGEVELVPENEDYFYIPQWCMIECLSTPAWTASGTVEVVSSGAVVLAGAPVASLAASKMFIYLSQVSGLASGDCRWAD